MPMDEVMKQRVAAYCTGCVKFDPERVECIAFIEPFPMWGKGECWAREEDPEAWAQTQREMEIHQSENEARKELERDRAEEIRKNRDKEIRDAYHEDVHHRLTKKKGGGEKSDRTHKIFTRERMKDNRLIIPWGEN